MTSFRCTHALASVLFLSHAASLSASASFQVLEHLPGADNWTAATAVSPEGNTVVGYSRSSAGYEACRWTSMEGLVNMGDVPGGALHSYATGVSANGSVVVGIGTRAQSNTSSTTNTAFRWTAAGGITALNAPLGLGDTAAWGVSSEGNVTVGAAYSADGAAQAVRWTSDQGAQVLGNGVAKAVSADGEQVAGFRTWDAGWGTSIEAFRWTEAGSMVGLGFLPSTVLQSTASGISPDGSMIVGYSHRSLNVVEAFLWTEASGMLPLGIPAGQDSTYAYGVSGNGIIVGESRLFTGNPQATIWDARHGWRYLKQVLTDDYALDLTGWELGVAFGISADGRVIAGECRNSDRQNLAWVVELPEPGTLSLLVFGFVAFNAHRRAKRFCSTILFG